MKFVLFLLLHSTYLFHILKRNMVNISAIKLIFSYHWFVKRGKSTKIKSGSTSCISFILRGEIWTYPPQRQKTYLRHVRPVKILISQRIGAVWSESSTGTFWTGNDAVFFMWTTKTLIRLRGYAGWSESSLDTHLWMHVSSRCGSYRGAFLPFFEMEKDEYTLSITFLIQLDEESITLVYMFLDTNMWAETSEIVPSDMCALKDDSNQPARPRSLPKVFLVRTKKLWILSHPKCAKRRFWSDCANANSDLNLRLALILEGTFSDIAFQNLWRCGSYVLRL